MRDKSLTIAEAMGSSVGVAPREVFYQKIRSDGSNDNSTTFTLKTPGRGWLLDNEVWLSYKAIITSTRAGGIRGYMFERAGGNAFYGSDTNEKYFPRANCPLSRCISNISVTLNGTSVNDQPHYIQDVMDRLWLSEDESESHNTPAAGFFDGPREFYPIIESTVPYAKEINVLNNHANSVGAVIRAGAINAGHYPNNPGVYFNNAVDPAGWYRIEGIKGLGPINGGTDAVVANNMGTFIGADLNDHEINWGAQRRWDKFRNRVYRSHWKSGGAANNVNLVAADYPQDLQVVFYERLPSSLFYQYNSRDKHGAIPHVESMTIIIQYLDALRFKWGQCSPGVVATRDDEKVADEGQMSGMLFADNAGFSDTIATSLVTQQDTNEVELHLKWLLPPPEMTIPSSVRIKAPRILVYPKVYGTYYRDNNTTLSAITQDVEFPWTPTKILVFVKVATNDLERYDPTEMFAEISSLDITVDGETGKLMQMTQAQLYSAWKRNGHPFDAKRFGFDEWRTKFCVAALDPGDYGTRTLPGRLGRFLLSVKPHIKIHEPQIKNYNIMTGWYSRETLKAEILDPDPQRRDYAGAGNAGNVVYRQRRYTMFIVGVNDSAYVELSPGGFGRSGIRASEPISESGAGIKTGAGVTGGGSNVGLLNFHF